VDAHALVARQVVDVARRERKVEQSIEAVVGGTKQFHVIARDAQPPRGIAGGGAVVVPAAQATSNSPAAPMPPPMHIVTTARFAPRRLPSINACPVRRWPLTPYGCPTAIAPPLTLS